MRTIPSLFAKILILSSMLVANSPVNKLNASENEQSSAVSSKDKAERSDWGDRFQEVAIPSTIDKSLQKAMVYLSATSTPQPLLVSLHSWSADYRQTDPLAAPIADAGWHYIHPDFRGPNKSPDSCASPKALCDIDDAISYVLENAPVDRTKIYVVGVSGGGHACCAYALNSNHPIRAAFAWVPITDISAWYHQSRNRGLKYASDIEAVLLSAEDFEKAATSRSPMSMPLPLMTQSLHLFAGIRDGYDGSVPISHSLLFFNRLCADMNENHAAVGHAELSALLTRDVRGSVGKLGDRDIFLQRHASFGSITIFDGGHEMLADACLQLLENDCQGRPVFTQ